MTLTHKIYEELKLSVQSSEHNELSKNQITKNNVSLIFALTKGTNIRKIYFPISEIDFNNIPQCRGLSMRKVRLLEYSLSECFCEISQTKNDEADIFEIIVEDIRKNSEKLPSQKDLVSLIVSILLKWKTFFAQERNIILSSERQQGLYGELYFLRELIKELGTAIVSSWTGCDYETHDYYIKGNAVEIKTTSTKAPYKMHISSEYQLDDTEIDKSLFVVFYALRKSMSDGESLINIIDEIRKLLKDNPIISSKFEQDLERYGYFDGLDNEYSLGYHIRENHSYEINSEFPRIIKNTLLKGISSCVYDVSIDCCVNHEISNDSLFCYLKGQD